MGLKGLWRLGGQERTVEGSSSPVVGAGSDTHEVMTISTSVSARGIQRPKQQSTDTTCLQENMMQVRVRQARPSQLFVARVQKRQICESEALGLPLADCCDWVRVEPASGPGLCTNQPK